MILLEKKILHVIIEFWDADSVVGTVVLCVICVSLFCSWTFSVLLSVSSGKMACGFPIANARYKTMNKIVDTNQTTKLCL
jgi:hypothetical protein